MTQYVRLCLTNGNFSLCNRRKCPGNGGTSKAKSAASSKEYGLLFPRPIGLQVRKQVNDLLGDDHHLCSTIDPLLLVHDQVCQQQSKLDDGIRRPAKQLKRRGA